MDKLFGLPIESVFSVIIFLLAGGLTLTGIMALRNRVLFKIGVRNIARRPAQTVLIILGLMLATLLVSATLVTGDTIKYSIQKTALEGLGEVDVIIKAENGRSNDTAGVGAILGTTAPRLNPDDLLRVESALKDRPVDGTTIIVRENIPATSPKSRRNLPGLEFLGVRADYTATLGDLKTASGNSLPVGALALDQAYLSAEAAKKLDVGTDDVITLFAQNVPVETKIAGIFAKGGKPSTGPTIIVPLARAQEMFSLGDEFSAILISGKGDGIEGASKTKVVMSALRPLFKDTPFVVDAVKNKALDNAEEQASMISSLFLVFGQFSMAAGIMLISLIFVMLAAERKVELGVLRAIGAKKGALVKIFLFEGAIYATLSAAVGVVLGVAVGWGMVQVIGAIFGQADFSPTFSFQPRSILLAYGIGLIATFAVVIFAARRAGRVNIVRAIRDLPEPVKTSRGYKSLIFLGLTLAAGVFSAMGGVSEQQQGSFLLGLSLIVIAIPLLSRWVRLPDRIAFTAAGLGLLALWLLPDGTLSSVIPDYDQYSAGMELFFLSGMAIVTGAVWTVMYNSDLLLKLVTTVFGRLKGFPPMLRIAVNYPLKARVPTGLTLAMLSLVVFTIVFMSILLNSMGAVFSDTAKLSGGYDIQGIVSPANPVGSVKQVLEEGSTDLRYEDFAAVGSLSITPIVTRQHEAKKSSWTNYAVVGVDAGYAKNVEYDFLLRSPEYATDREVWKALIEEDNVAIVHPSLVPAKVSFTAGQPTPPFQMSGFYRDGGELPRTYIEAKDPVTGEIGKLRIIGVLDDSAYTLFGSIITSHEKVGEIVGAPVAPSQYWFKTAPGQSAADAAEDLSETFYKNGLETVLVQEDIAKDMSSSLMFNRLLEGFMGLGLLVGIAAMGVIAARSIVERRRVIGMLRAIGFKSGLVQRTFFLESSFIASLGITLGSVLALVLCRNVIATMANDMPGLTYQVPWVEVALIAGIAYMASLAATYLPARQASKIMPAEALRYE